MSSLPGEDKNVCVCSSCCSLFLIKVFLFFLQKPANQKAPTRPANQTSRSSQRTVSYTHTMTHTFLSRFMCVKDVCVCDLWPRSSSVFSVSLCDPQLGEIIFFLPQPRTSMCDGLRRRTVQLWPLTLLPFDLSWLLRDSNSLVNRTRPIWTDGLERLLDGLNPDSSSVWVRSSLFHPGQLQTFFSGPIRSCRRLVLISDWLELRNSPGFLLVEELVWILQS